MGRNRRKAVAAPPDRSAAARPVPSPAASPPSRGQFRLLVISAAVLVAWLMALAILAIRAHRG